MYYSLEPGSFNLCGRNKEPGTHCLRMLQIAPEFRRDRKLSCTFALCSTYEYVITAMANPAHADFDSRLKIACESVGYPNLSLKAEQKEAVLQVCNGNDVFAWLPTGFGKSLCYELLPFLLECSRDGCDSLVLVVSPLVSLMVSQVQSLRRRRVKACILSHKVEKALLATEEDLITCRFLFGAPEAIMCSSWTKELQRTEIGGRIVAVTVDEAHCVSKW